MADTKINAVDFLHDALYQRGGQTKCDMPRGMEDSGLECPNISAQHAVAARVEGSRWTKMENYFYSYINDVFFNSKPAPYFS